MGHVADAPTRDEAEPRSGLQADAHAKRLGMAAEEVAVESDLAWGAMRPGVLGEFEKSLLGLAWSHRGYKLD